MPESEKPGVLDRLRARYGWFDHLMRAKDRYYDCHGNFFAAGLTFFTVFALFPLLMVGFAVVGFMLSREPHVLAGIEDRIKHTVAGEFGDHLVRLMEAAIASRTSVGIIGLVGGLWAGLVWMAYLRGALTEMWGEHLKSGNFVMTKLSDLVALVSVFVAIVVTIGLTALTGPTVMARVLARFGLHQLPGIGALLRVASLLVAVGISWLLFTWMIARLPRKSLGFASAARAGLLSAVGFEIFKQVGSVYLGRVLHGPAGVAFGPTLGVMVFAYITSRLVLFATAWAATSPENLTALPVSPPQPAVVVLRRRDGVPIAAALAVMALGALAALGISWVRRR